MTLIIVREEFEECLLSTVLSKSAHQNRAEVGVGRQMGIPSSMDKTVVGQVSQKVGKVPSQSGQIIFHTDRLDGGSEHPVLLTPPRAATSPSRFTRFVQKISVYGLINTSITGRIFTHDSLPTLLSEMHVHNLLCV